MLDFKDRKVVLVIPNNTWRMKREWKLLSHYAPILTAILKNWCDFYLIDCNGHNLSEEALAARLEEINPDFVLTSGLSSEYYEQPHLVALIAKKTCPSAITILGGVYPTVLPEECLSDVNVDFIFMGYAEERLKVFLQLIFSDDKERLNVFPGIGFKARDSLHINAMKMNIGCVNKAECPDYSLLDLNPYLINNTTDYQFSSTIPCASIFTSFGCPYNCVFCATRTISGRGVLYRPIDEVLEEIEYLIKTYGVQRLLFLDDSFLLKRERVVSLFRAMIDRKYNLKWNVGTVSSWHMDDELIELMKESGCFQLTIAIESGCQDVIDNIIHKPLKLSTVEKVVKKCRKEGIDIAGSFVIGFPGETWANLRETFQFAYDLDLDLAHFHIATPLPKTDLYHLAKERGLLPDNFSFVDPKYFGFAEPFVETKEFSKFELKILRAFEWDRINFKNEKKIAKVAQMYNMSIPQLEKFRQKTRQKLGIYCDRVADM